VRIKGKTHHMRLPWILLNIISLSTFQSIQTKKNYDVPKTGDFSSKKIIATNIIHLKPLPYPLDSWQYFLQHLPTEDKPILDFNGKAISNQAKHFAILTYDVGHSDLQQCADALIRIRSEYLFSQKKYSQIGFHFNSGYFYSWYDYLRGVRPQLKGSNLVLIHLATASEISHVSLRKYLDLVYAYANTISLCRELKSTDSLETGTIIIYPGNPGHCCMIVDEAIGDKSDTVFKIVEGYMPAQSIYILSNPYEPEWSPWYHLKKGEISTASCIFRSYYLKKFE
jgi:hypothetical protein